MALPFITKYSICQVEKTSWLNLDDQLLLMQASINGNNQASDEKIKTYDSNLDKIKTLLKQVMIQNQNSS